MNRSDDSLHAVVVLQGRAWAGTIIIHFGKTNPKYWRHFKVLTIQTFRIFVAPSNFSALPIKPYFDNADFHIGSMGIFELVIVSRRSIDLTGWRGVHRRERNVCRVTPGHIARRGAIVEDDPRYTRSEVNDPTTKVCAVGCFAMRRAAHGEQSKRPLSGAAVNYAFTSRRPVRVIRDV